MNPGSSLGDSPAASAARPLDRIALTAHQLFSLSFFSKLKDPTRLDGAAEGLHLRRVRAGETICRQGEPGWTAMCLLGAEDLLKLKEPILDLARLDGTEGEALKRLQQAAEGRSRELQSDDEAELGIAVYLAQPRKPDPAPSLWSRLFPHRTSGTVADPAVLPINASHPLGYEVRRARIYEGELFGELNCRGGEPRSATLVAEKDGYLAEISGNLIDLLENDPVFREQIDKIYLKRGFEHELLSLAIFEDLDPSQIDRVRQGVELVRCRPQEVIFQENDLSDAIYIIRKGMVQTVKRFTDLVGLADVPDWKALFDRLEILRDANAPDTWRRVAERIDWSAPEPLDPFQNAEPDPGAMTTAEKQEWLHKLNAFVKEPIAFDGGTLPDPPAGTTLQDLWPRSPSADKPTLPSNPEAVTLASGWTAQEKSSFGRNWLDAVLGTVIVPRPGRDDSVGREGSDAVQVLSYMTRGEYFGEMGVLADQPRSATCIAFAPPDSGAQEQPLTAANAAGAKKKREEFIELVKIPGDLFQEILADAPALRRKVDQKVAKRHQNDRVLLGGPTSAAHAEV